MVRFMQERYGIDLSQKKQLIISRLSHSLKSRGFSSFRAFLDQLISKETSMPVRIAEEPLDCVADGTGIRLQGPPISSKNNYRRRT